MPYAEQFGRSFHEAVRTRLDGIAEFVDVSWSDYAYFELLSSLWTAGEDFCIVEQDILPRSDALDHLQRCPHWWCAYPYQGPPDLGLLRESLGCTRFRAGLMRQEPDVFVQAEELNTRHWYGVDYGLATALKRRGHIVHSHEEGEVQHLHLYG